jgi:hypothetical protein
MVRQVEAELAQGCAAACAIDSVCRMAAPKLRAQAFDWPTTTRYFVDKMPWYQNADDDRIWIAYVDAERTLQGFETLLDQYRALLSSRPPASLMWRRPSGTE